MHKVINECTVTKMTKVGYVVEYHTNSGLGACMESPRTGCRLVTIKIVTIHLLFYVLTLKQIFLMEQPSLKLRAFSSKNGGIIFRTYSYWPNPGVPLTQFKSLLLSYR